MSGPVIRRAAANDAEALHAALARLALHLGTAEEFHADAADYLRHGFGARPLFHALLAEAAGETLGVAVFFPEFSTMRGRPGVYLQDLWVAEGVRGSGLGRRLLGSVLREAAGWEAAYMKLATHIANPEAVRFYRGLGFRTDEGERVFVIEGAVLDRLKGER